MVSPRIATVAALFTVVVMAFARMEIAVCDDRQLVKGSVECVDCKKNYDYSGIKVQVKCDNSKEPLLATTKKDGSYSAQAAHDHLITPTSNCHARILGGPKQLYASKKTMTSKVTLATASDDDSSNPQATAAILPFAITCSRKLGTKCSASRNAAEFGASKTINFPIPPEYGLAPFSLYFPVMPIIGIP